MEENIRITARKAIRASQLRRSFWQKALAFDQVAQSRKDNRTSSFVIFSSTNPYLRAIDRAYNVLMVVTGKRRSL